MCDAFDLPMASLCDTPGFMVGPDAEQTATVRHFSRMFLTGSGLLAPDFTVSWPTGEFGPMGIEGAVHLGFGSRPLTRWWPLPTSAARA
jgi:acetyl-CoA carboxylase carboxyltransferase component